jgi:hypothetical protein
MCIKVKKRKDENRAIINFNLMVMFVIYLAADRHGVVIFNLSHTVFYSAILFLLDKVNITLFEDGLYLFLRMQTIAWMLVLLSHVQYRILTIQYFICSIGIEVWVLSVFICKFHFYYGRFKEKFKKNFYGYDVYAAQCIKFKEKIKYKKAYYVIPCAPFLGVVFYKFTVIENFIAFFTLLSFWLSFLAFIFQCAFQMVCFFYVRKTLNLKGWSSK